MMYPGKKYSNHNYLSGGSSHPFRSSIFSEPGKNWRGECNNIECCNKDRASCCNRASYCSSPRKRSCKETDISAYPMTNSWLSSWGLDDTPNDNRSLIKSLLDNSISGLDDSACYTDDMSVVENAREFILKMPAADLSREDIAINVRNMGNRRNLEISWHRGSHERSSGDNIVWMGSAWSSGSRSVPIPSNCDIDAIKAKIRNGSLTVIMPKLSKHRHERGSSIEIE